MDYLVTPSSLMGTLCPPPSKSFSHRRIFMAMLSKKEMILTDVLDCQDTNATLSCFKSLGAVYRWQHDCLILDSSLLFKKKPQRMQVGASASTLRFLIPICLTQAGCYCFRMDEQLSRRSLAAYEESLKTMARFERVGCTIKVSGQLRPGHYQIDASMSSQFVSGLLMALPLLEGDSSLELSTKMVSIPYVKMTLACLKAAGIHIYQVSSSLFKIPGRQHYDFCDLPSQLDASSAAFFEVAKYLGQPLIVKLGSVSYQADACLKPILEKIGQGPLKVNVENMPDLVPALSLAMALSPYRYEITHAARLKDKESNRLLAVTKTLQAMGANITQHNDGLVIEGVEKLHGATVSSYHDHRIAMMAIIAASLANGRTTLLDGDCVAKSWPDFFDVYRRLGGIIDELPLRH